MPKQGLSPTAKKLMARYVASLTDGDLVYLDDLTDYVYRNHRQITVSRRSATSWCHANPELTHVESGIWAKVLNP